MIWSAIVSSFLASTVEFVEALTIVLAVGVTINWRSSLLGAGSALVALAALVALFGSTLVIFIPIETLRLIIGIILLLFGMQWLKKALLRYSGLKAIHDEAEIYEEEMRKLKIQGGINQHKFNAFGFVTSFKSVLLEGLEVAFIVITFGATSEVGKFQGIWNATIGASLAFLVVAVFGFIARGPLTRIPENTLKFIVGIMLVAFGTFWSGEGIGIEWLFSDLFLLVLAAFFLILSAGIVRWLKPYGTTQTKPGTHAGVERRRSLIANAFNAIFDFFCGDWRIFWGITGTLMLIELVEHLTSFAAAVPFAGLIYIIGISLSLIIALKREI